MKTVLSTFHAFRVKILALLAVLAIGGAALSLGGCTCADANGNQIDCPYAAQGMILIGSGYICCTAADLERKGKSLRPRSVGEI